MSTKTGTFVERSEVEGYVYVLSNPSMPGRVKIGRSERTPSERVAELSSATGVPEAFVLNYWERVRDCILVERIVHWRLEPLRVPNREFFNMSVSSAIRVVAEVCFPWRLQVTMPVIVEIREGPCPRCRVAVQFPAKARSDRAHCVNGHVVHRDDLPIVGRRSDLVDVTPPSGAICPTCGADLKSVQDYRICSRAGCGYLFRSSDKYPRGEVRLMN